MTQEEARLRKRLQELADRAYQKGVYTHTNFLSAGELAVLFSMHRELACVPCAVFGGMEGCERQMAQFGAEVPQGCRPSFPIACLQISPVSRKFANALTHRDFLGALIHLGIERDTLGDIVIRDNEGFVFCTDAIAPFILANLEQVGNAPVCCNLADSLPEGELFALAPEMVQVTSERADAVVARAYRLPREESLTLFRSKRVFLNGIPCENNSAALKPQDVISVRGFGRFVYRGVEGTSKKGKLNVKIEKYE